MEDSTSGSSNGTIIAAVILALGLVAGGFLVASALDRGSQEIASVRDAILDLEDAIGAPPPSPAPTARRGPDPAKRYAIAIKDEPVVGPKDAAVTIVEFSDFQCPFCRRVNPTLDQIKKTYGEQVRIAFKHLPLAMHSKAPEAHAAAEAAHRQGKFWEMHDAIFSQPAKLSRDQYISYARALKLDVARFERDLVSKEVKDKVEADKRMASSLGVTGTPAFFVNGRFLSGAKPFESFKAVIDEELRNKRKS